jgi:predicted lipoprotein with Yx(FWY)xxD motif
MHRPQSRSLRVGVLLGALVAALTVVGTGTADAKTSKTSKPTTVKVVTLPNVGAALVDTTSGRTLYTLTDANGAAVACTGTCLQAWPAFASTTAKATAPKGVTNLAVAKDTHQVTWKGLPLYFFVKDTAAGTANGEGIVSFGGTWHVVRTSAKPTAASTATTTKRSSSGSDYGY